LTYHEHIVDEERADLRGPHPGTKRLIAYRQGTLPAAERDALQEHLSLCARCTGLLRELRDFEAASAEESAAARKETTEPDPQREEAWAALVRRLPAKPAAIRPVAPLPQRRSSSFAWIAIASIAALILAVAGLSILVRAERQRSAQLEHRLAVGNQMLASVQRSLADTGRQLDIAHGRIRVLERRPVPAPAAPPSPGDRLAAALDVSLEPRFVLRGQEPDGSESLRGGETNRVTQQQHRFTVGLDLPDSPVFPEIRIELTDRAGAVVWSGRRPGDVLAGGDGATLTVGGLRPGRYRLRIEGLQPDRTRFLGEYVLDVT
jgi:hypothetical protein